MPTRLDLLPLRHHGARRGLIVPHRGLRRMPVSRTQSLHALLLALVLTAVVVAGIPLLATLWRWLFAAAAPMLHPGATLGEIPPAWPLTQPLPAVHVAQTMPSAHALGMTTAATAAALLLSYVLPMVALPLAYALRVGAGVQATAILFFAVAPARMIARLPDVPSSTLGAKVAIICLIPAVLGFTYYVFDVSLARKLALTAAMVAHLGVLAPLQHLLQAELIAGGTALFGPICFFLLGPGLDVMIFVALYGWGASWPSASAAQGWGQNLRLADLRGASWSTRRTMEWRAARG